MSAPFSNQRAKRSRVPKPLDPGQIASLLKSPSFSAAVRDGAHRFIDEDPLYGKATDNLLSPRRQLEQIAEQLRVATQKQHIEAVAFAYAFWVRASENPAYADFLTDAAKGWRRITRATTGLHLIVSRFVSYGDDDTSPTGAKRGLYNRDVHSILWLQESGVPPDRVVELSEKPGEGLRAWDINQRKRRPEKPSSNVSLESFLAEHDRKRRLHTPLVPSETSIEICLSYREGLAAGQHKFYKLPNTAEARRIVEAFCRDIQAERTRVLVGRARTYNAVTRPDKPADVSLQAPLEPT